MLTSVEPLTYTGKINLKIGNKTHTIYNNGTDTLFKFFAKALVEDWDLTLGNLSPRYLTVKDSEDKPLLNSPTEVFKQSKQIENTWAAVITCALTDSNFNNNSPAGGDCSLVLLDGGGFELASAQLDSNVLQQVSTGRQILIEWYLYVDNGE